MGSELRTSSSADGEEPRISRTTPVSSRGPAAQLLPHADIRRAEGSARLAARPGRGSVANTERSIESAEPLRCHPEARPRSSCLTRISAGPRDLLGSPRGPGAAASQIPRGASNQPNHSGVIPRPGRAAPASRGYPQGRGICSARREAWARQRREYRRNNGHQHGRSRSCRAASAASLMAAAVRSLGPAKPAASAERGEAGPRDDTTVGGVSWHHRRRSEDPFISG